MKFLLVYRITIFQSDLHIRKKKAPMGIDWMNEVQSSYQSESFSLIGVLIWIKLIYDVNRSI